jgi:hypothetical protein
MPAKKPEKPWTFKPETEAGREALRRAERFMAVHAKDKVASRATLVRLGILTPSGKLSKNYR